MLTHFQFRYYNWFDDQLRELEQFYAKGDVSYVKHSPDDFLVQSELTEGEIEPNTVLVVDDYQFALEHLDRKKLSRAEELFTGQIRHNSCFLFIVLQSLFTSRNLLRLIVRQSTKLLLLASDPRLLTTLKSVSRQFYGSDSLLGDICHDLPPYTSLLIDLNPQSPRHIHLRTVRSDWRKCRFFKPAAAVDDD